MFGKRLHEIDRRLSAAYQLELPAGEVWVDPDAFKQEPIGGTYDWWSDRIVLAEGSEDYLAHELVHRYNRHAFGDLPRWLDEGLAYALARGSNLDALETPARRKPDFEALAEIRDARARSRTGGFPAMEDVFSDPYANGHLNVRIATAVVDRLLRDRAADRSMHAVLVSVVQTARELSPGAAAAILDRTAFQDFPRPDELRALLADETVSDELVEAIVPALDLERASKAAAPDPCARRRLALLLDRERAPENRDAELLLLDQLLLDQDPRVSRAATYALGARGDRRMIGALIEVLKDAPLFRFVKQHSRKNGVSYEAVPVHKTLARLAGETPGGVTVEAFDDAYPLPYRVIEAWEKWWLTKQREPLPPLVPTLRRRY